MPEQPKVWSKPRFRLNCWLIPNSHTHSFLTFFLVLFSEIQYLFNCFQITYSTVFEITIQLLLKRSAQLSLCPSHAHIQNEKQLMYVIQNVSWVTKWLHFGESKSLFTLYHSGTNCFVGGQEMSMHLCSIPQQLALSASSKDAMPTRKGENH